MLDLPLEYALIKFKGNKLTGKIVPELLDLADKGIVRFVDIVFIQKEKDGNIRTVELNDLEQDAYEMFVPIGNHVSSLFTEQDLQIAAGKLPKNSAAALLPVGKPVDGQSPQGDRGMLAALSSSAGKSRPKWCRSSRRNWPQKRRRNRGEENRCCQEETGSEKDLGSEEVIAAGSLFKIIQRRIYHAY